MAKVNSIEIRRAHSGKQYLVLCTEDGYVILDDDGYPEKTFYRHS